MNSQNLDSINISCPNGNHSLEQIEEQKNPIESYRTQNEIGVRSYSFQMNDIQKAKSTNI